jgi:stage III sporulation protein AA
MIKIETSEISNILPLGIRNEFNNIKRNEELQEIRIKVDKNLIFETKNCEIISQYKPSKEDIKLIVQRMSNYSIYAFESEIKQGFITIKGGHRVGICGRCVIEDNRVKTIKDIASINIRICREIRGCSSLVLPFIIREGKILNTIIISPPRCGKTTILRDLVRLISDGKEDIKLSGRKVCVVDERGEIAACFSGVPQLNVGLRTDVLDSCPKSEGIMMAIRSMAPEIIVCDEIGTYKDMESILAAMNCGVSLITSIHGSGTEDLYNRAVFKDLMDNNVFERAIVLSSSCGAGTCEYIYDFTKKEIIWRR